MIDSSITDRDTLNARVTTSATPTLIANVENINVDVAGFGVTLDLLNVRHGSTGGGEVALSTSQVGNSTVSVTNVGANNINLKVAPSITTLNLTGTANANDATRITLQGDVSIAHTATANGVETVTFLGDGAARTVTLTAGTGGVANQYIVDGSQGVVLAGDAGRFTARQVLEAAGYNGTTRLDLSAGAANADLSNVQLDTIRLTGALGNNAITFRNNATVSVASAAALNTATGNVGMGANTGNVANTGTATTLNLINDHASGMGSGHTFTVGAAVDVLNITLNQAMGSGTGGGTFTLLNNANSGGVSSINLLGSQAANLTVGAMSGNGATDNLVINGVGLSNALTLSASGTNGHAGLFTVLLPNVASTVSFGSTSGAGATIIGGNGNDTITGGAWADSVNAGSGSDTITLSDGADTILGGAGSDAYRFTSGAATGSRIDDFVKGTDRIVLLGTGSTGAAAALTDASSVVLAGGGFSGITGYTSAGLVLRNGGSVLANTVSGTGDDWTDSIQFGRATGATYGITTGSTTAPGAVVAGQFDDFITLANATGGTTRSVSLGAGNDWLSLTAGANTHTGSLTISGGAGSDTITLDGTAGSSGVATVRFESTASVNGNDTINGFAGGTGAGLYDVLDFRTFLGNLGGDSSRVYQGTTGSAGVARLGVADGTGSAAGAIDFTAASGAGTASSGGVAGSTGNDVFVIFDGQATLTSARFVSGTAAAVNQIAIADGTKSVVIQSLGGLSSTVANIYYVENGAVAGLDDLVITQVGVVNFLAGAGVNTLVRENFI